VKVADIYIGAVGVYLPDRVMSTDEAVSLGLYCADDVPEFGLPGVTVAGTKSPSEMAVIASLNALSRSGISAAQLDLMIHASAFREGPEMWSTPGYVLREIGAGNIPSLEVRQGCNGLLTAMEVAVGLLNAGGCRRSTALLTAAVNLESPVVDRWQSGRPGFLLGDGASAILLTRRPGIARLLALNSTTIPELEGMHRGAEPLHPAGATLGRAIDLGGRAAHFGRHEMPLADATELIGKWTAELARQSTADAGLEISDITRVCHSSAARWLVAGWMKALGLPMSRSVWDYSRTLAHLGATDQVAAVDHLLGTRRLAPGDRVLLIGNSPGFSIASALIEITEEASWTVSPSPSSA
jgi:3-oxoacyl-[acyl-carrier-protein] synthase III